MLPSTRAYVRNLVSMFLWQGGNYLAPLVTLPYLARVLGPSALGEVALAVAVTAYFVLLTEWGFSLSASRRVAQTASSPEELQLTFWGTVSAKALNGVLSLLALAIVTMAVPALREITPLIAAASLALLANVLTLNWCLQGLERLDLLAGASLAGKLATIPLTFVLVHSPSDAWLSILVQTGTALLTGFVSIVLVRRLDVIGPMLLSLRNTLHALRQAGHLFVSSAATSLYTTSNVVVLAALTSTAQVGLYSGADRLRAAAQSLTNPVADASYPRVARLLQHDPVVAFRFVRRLIFAQGLLTLGIAISLLSGAPLIVSVILGPGYEGAVPILQVLAWVPFVVGISNVFALQVLLQSGRQHIFTRIIVFALPFHLALIVPLVWSLGAQGAALSSLVTEILIMIAIVSASLWTTPRLWQGVLTERKAV